MSFLIKQGQTLVCLGDSITQASDGYVSVMEALITAKYPERAIKIVNAGIGGNKVPDMLARLQTDVLAHKPDWVTVNVGINDVWHGMGDAANGVPLSVYEPTLTAIVETTKAAGAQVVLVTPTVIGEELDLDSNKTLSEYVHTMEKIGHKHNVRVAPTHADFVQTLRAGKSVNSEFHMTTGGVHMNATGNARMALTILETFGF